MSFLNLEACTNLMRGDTKKLCADPSYSLTGLPQPYTPYVKSAHDDAYSMVYNLLLKFRCSKW